MSKTSSTSFTMYPTEWLAVANEPQILLYVSGIVTTGYHIGANITIKDSSENQVGSISVPNTTTGFSAISASPVSITIPHTSFPISVEVDISSTDSPVIDIIDTPQVPLGDKNKTKNTNADEATYPAAYQVSVLVNDSGSDNDYNDLALNIQLFNASTD